MTVSRSAQEPGWVFSPSDQQSHSALWQGTAVRYSYSDDAKPGVLQNSASNADDTGATFNTFSSMSGDVSFASYSTIGGTVAGLNMMTLDWQGDASAVITLNQAWSSTRGIDVAQFSGTSLVLQNWSDAWVHLSDNMDHAITLDGSKRGEVVLGNGNNTVVIGAENNDPYWTIGFKVVTGSGNDTITLGLSSRNYVGDTYDGALTKSWLDAGAGNDVVHGGTGDDVVYGGAGDDLIDTGTGNDDIWGGAGRNTITGGCGNDTAHFAGTAADYEIAVSNGKVLIDGLGERSTLSGIEVLSFADGTSVRVTPGASNDLVQVAADAATPELSTVLLSNDRAIDDCDTLRITAVDTTGTVGRVAFDAVTGQLAYTASHQAALAEGEHGTDQFTYSVSDGRGGFSTATVTLDVVGTNDAVVLGSDAAGPHSIVEAAKVTGSAARQSTSGELRFTDADLSDTHEATAGPANFSWSGGALGVDQVAVLRTASVLDLQVSDSTGTGAGSVQFAYGAADKTFDFLGKGETLTVSYDVRVADGYGSSSTQAVSILVTGANDGPVALPDIAGVGQCSTVKVGAASGVLANDRDADLRDTLSVTAISNDCGSSTVSAGSAGTLRGDYGTLTLKSDGSYAYKTDLAGLIKQVLNCDLVAQDTFTYTASDGNGGTTKSTLTMTVANPFQTYVQGTDGNDTLLDSTSKTVLGQFFGLSESAILDGGNGNDTLIGGNNCDVLIGGGGNNRMTGGGASDTFVFGKQAGASIVTDFKAGLDEIQFDKDVFSNFAAVKSHAVQVGSDVLITADADYTITLQNIALKNLKVADFHFA